MFFEFNVFLCFHCFLEQKNNKNRRCFLYFIYSPYLEQKIVLKNYNKKCPTLCFIFYFSIFVHIINLTKSSSSLLHSFKRK